MTREQMEEQRNAGEFNEDMTEVEYSLVADEFFRSANKALRTTDTDLKTGERVIECIRARASMG